MTHIAVNTRLLLSSRLEGISRFAYEVLRRMVERHPEIRFTFFFDRSFDEQFVFGSNVEPIALAPQARHPLLWKAWFHHRLPARMKRIKPDLFFSPEFYLCKNADPAMPQIPVFHDIAYEHYPEDIGKWAAQYCQKYSPQYAKLASHILTVSEYSKQDIIKHYGLSGDRISVVYNGASEGFRPLQEAEQMKVREQYSQGQAYFHFVGTLHPRKNIESLLKAFDLFKSRNPSKLKLLLVGRKGWQYKSAMETFEQMEFREDVLFTGFVPDEDLSKIYSASMGLCYIPYFEGFGIPILEAFHSETAVICSNISSMPEVAGDAAILVDPFDIEGVANAMLSLHQDKNYRETLIEKAKERRKKFSWELTYNKVWDVVSSNFG